jgi:ankyrin repeat protein
MDLLLTYGCDPNIQLKPEFGCSTPLHIAAGKGYKKLVEILLNHYADPNIQDSQGFTPLHIAARAGFLDVAKLLLSKGCCPTVLDAQGKSACYWAKEYQYEVISQLFPDDGKYDYISYIEKEKKEGNGNITVIVSDLPKKNKKKKKSKK